MFITFIASRASFVCRVVSTVLHTTVNDFTSNKLISAIVLLILIVIGKWTIYKTK